jgi:hypothetical protein
MFTYCRVVWSSEQASYQVAGMTVDVSKNGLAVLLRNPAQPIWQEATIHILNDLQLRAAPVHKQAWTKRVDGSQVGFMVKQIVSGEQQWEAMCNGSNGSHSVTPQGQV